MTNPMHLAAACAAMVVLVFIVALRLLAVRVAEMKQRRIPPQAAATSLQVAAKLEDVRAADNYRNLFEAPVLFYPLCVLAIATDYTPGWLVAGAWTFVALRSAHSAIQCTYNRVMHRFAAFAASLVVLVGLWIGVVAGLIARAG